MTVTRLFVSYASEDRPAVAEIIAHVRRTAEARKWCLDVWWDRSNLIGGCNFTPQIGNAIDQAHIGLVCLSSGSATRQGYVRREWELLMSRRGSGELTLIPVLLEPSKLPARLNQIHAVEAFNETGRHALTTAIERALIQADPTIITGFDAELEALARTLRTGDWRAADEATTEVVQQVLAQDDGSLAAREALRLVLQQIDQLWLNNSAQRFGFSVQRSQWRAAATSALLSVAFRNLGTAVGWYVQGNWPSTYCDLIFADSAPSGHLPSLRRPAEDMESYWFEAWRARVGRVQAILGAT
jgi:hypothetical protein